MRVHDGECRYEHSAVFGGALSLGGVGVLLWLSSAPVMAATDNAKAHLKPEQLRVIQGVGQTLLAAKQAQKEDPELHHIRESIMQVRTAIREFQLAEAEEQDATQVNQVPNATTPRMNAQANLQAFRTKRIEARNKLGRIAPAVHERRMIVDQRLTAADGNKDISFVTKRAAAKLAELENVLTKALEGTEDEQSKKLARLMKRLEPRDRIRSAPPDVMPTIVTNTRHRN